MDRPRGQRPSTRTRAKADIWLKEIAPSRELRQWFGHDPGRWAEFKARYRDELGAPERADALEQLRALQREHETVTLLFGAREETHNHAAFLRDLLDGGAR